MENYCNQGTITTLISIEKRRLHEIEGYAQYTQMMR